MKEKGFSKERNSNKNFCTFIRLIFRSNFFQNLVFFERTAFERKPKIRKVRKNGIQKKKIYFERMLFDQTTSSQSYSMKIYAVIVVVSIAITIGHCKEEAASGVTNKGIVHCIWYLVLIYKLKLLWSRIIIFFYNSLIKAVWKLPYILAYKSRNLGQNKSPILPFRLIHGPTV